MGGRRSSVRNKVNLKVPAEGTPGPVQERQAGGQAAGGAAPRLAGARSSAGAAEGLEAGQAVRPAGAAGGVIFHCVSAALLSKASCPTGH